MRPILATTATALAVSVVMSTVVFAQKAKTDAARASRAEATGSLNDSYNRCVTLAQSRSREKLCSTLHARQAALSGFRVLLTRRTCSVWAHA
jgi:hypothetical protein